MFERDINHSSESGSAIEFEGGDKSSDSIRDELEGLVQESEHEDIPINPSEIHLNLDQAVMQEPRTDSMPGPTAQREITYQRNPNYPGQIFFIESSS